MIRNSIPYVILLTSQHPRGLRSSKTVMQADSGIKPGAGSGPRSLMPYFSSSMWRSEPCELQMWAGMSDSCATVGAASATTSMQHSTVQVCALPSPCNLVMSARRNTLLNLSWQACETCSISVELTRSIWIDPLAVMDAVRLAPRT